MKGTGGNTYDSIIDLMNDLRFEIIEYTQREIDQRVRYEEFYSNVDIIDSDKEYSPKKDSISVYVDVMGSDAEVGAPDEEEELELVAKLRLSDHDMTTKRESTIRDIVILIDVDDAIEVRGKNGVKCVWSELAWDPQKKDLINGRSTKLSNDSSDTRKIVNAKFMIAPSDEGRIVNDSRNKIMAAIDEFIWKKLSGRSGGGH